MRLLLFSSLILLHFNSAWSKPVDNGDEYRYVELFEAETTIRRVHEQHIASPDVFKVEASHKTSSNFPDIIDDVKQAWVAFKKEFKRIYTTLEEEEERLMVFVKSFIHIQQHNKLYTAGKKSFKLSVNKFSDWKEEELKVLRGFRPTETNKTIGGSFYLSPAVPNLVLPVSKDWRQHGYVTPVKNQGACGSCWSFATTGALEGQNFKKTKQLTSLSEQQLVDCDVSDNGCNGGIMTAAYEYIKKNGGVETETVYPYVSGDTHKREPKCMFDKSKVVATSSGFVQLPEGDEETLLEASATIGPIAIAIDASQPDFQSYSKGVYDSDTCSSANLDHAVLLVGYGIEDDIPYWLVKNSWSDAWGEDGYIKMRRNKNNMCGIASFGVYPLV